MPRHDRVQFSEAASGEHEGFIGFKARGFPGTIAKGRPVCYYDDTGNQTLYVQAATPSTVMLGGGAFAQNARRKIFGVAMTALYSSTAGYVCVGGRVNKLWVTGTVAVGDYLRLGTNQCAAATSVIGNHDVFAIAQGTNTGASTQIPAMVVLWRP